MSGQVKSISEGSNQVGIGQVISGQVDSSMDILSHFKSTQDRSSQLGTSQVMSGQVR